MSIATYSVESQINRILNELDCAVSNFAAIANNLSGSRVAAALAGTNDFSAEDGEHYLRVARQMKQLAQEFPVPIDWKQTRVIKELLAARRIQVRPFPFAVILVGANKLFKRVENGVMQTTTSYKDCAGFKDELVAVTAAKTLNDLSGQSLRVITVTNQHRDPETISDKLVDCGFQD